MPYYISDKQPDCQGEGKWAVIKLVDDKPVTVACHDSKQSAVDQMVAVSMSEGMKPMGQYFGQRSVDSGQYNPPAGVQAAAKRALKWISEGKAGSGFTAVGRNRAAQLASGRAVSAMVVNKMIAYFARHEVDKKAEGFSQGEKGYPSPGRVAWDAWGGDAGQSWVNGLNKRDQDLRDGGDGNNRILICDIDDTIIHNGKLIQDVASWVGKQEVGIYLVTGRLESQREETVAELGRLGMDYDRLLMNNLGSSAKSIEFKKQTAEKLLQNYDVVLAIDNDGGAREAYSSLGIPVIDPTKLPMNRGSMQRDMNMGVQQTANPMEAPEAPITKQDLEMRLRDLLGDVVNFKFLAHGFHWNVRGINFAQFHEFFGEIYEDADNSIDPIAENIRKINFDAPFKLTDFMESVDELEPTDSSDPLEMCRSLYQANEDVRESIVHALCAADELEEQGIVNFLAERQDMHSKWQWQLRAIVGDSFAKNYEIDVLSVYEGKQTGEGTETEKEIDTVPADNPQSAATNPNGVPMMQQNSAKTKWANAANLILRKLDPVQEVHVEARKKNFETRVNHANVEFREVQGGNGMTFEGYAAVFNSPSDPIGGQFTEYVLPGAFKRSLEARNDVKLLWNHDTGEVLGSTRSGTLKLVEDSHGLKAIAELPNTQRGRDTAELLRRGDIANMSFGFTVPKGGDSWRDNGSTRELHSVRLHEVSIVAFPAYQASSASVRSVTIDADTLADGLMRLENGEELDSAQAEAISEVVAKLTKTAEVQEAGDILSLKKKQLDLMMKRI